jgi:two-component system, cell cycle response regulator DivK
MLPTSGKNRRSRPLKGDREKTLEAGCPGHIEKPIDPATFVNEVKKYL